MENIVKTKSIFLCASMSFYKELVGIEERLEAKGFTVNIPISAQTMKKNNDFEVSHFKGVFTYTQKADFIHRNFETIFQSDAILVINNKKNGINGYIGANVLMEIGLAFYLKKKIFIWNSVPEDAPYREELLAFGVKVVDQKLERISF